MMNMSMLDVRSVSGPTHLICGVITTGIHITHRERPVYVCVCVFVDATEPSVKALGHLGLAG